MEVASQKRWLSFKIKLLQEERDHLISSLNDHVNKILQQGITWMDGTKENSKGKTLSYKDINSLIEDTASLMAQKYADLTGDVQDTSVVQASSADITTHSPQVKVTAIQTTDATESALSRIQVLEEAVSSLSITVGKHSENLSETNTCIGNLTDKQCQMSEDQIKVSTETEESLKQLTYKHTKTEMEQNKKFEDLEHKLKALEKAQSEVDEKTAQINEKPDLEASLKSLKKDVKKQNTDLSSLKGHIEETLAKKVEDVAQKVTKQEKSVKKINKLEQRLDALEEREAENIEKVETVEKKLACEKIKLENFEAVEKQREEKLEVVERKLDQVSSKVDDQKSSIQELITTVETLSNTAETQKSSIQELTTTVATHSISLENITSSGQTDAAQLIRLHNKVRVIKRERNQAIKKVGEQFDDVGQKYQMVCKIVADRLVPLERLREILNEKAKHSEENVEKLYQVVKDVADLVPKVSQIEDQLTQSTSDVTAQLQDVRKDFSAQLSGVSQMVAERSREKASVSKIYSKDDYAVVNRFKNEDVQTAVDDYLGWGCRGSSDAIRFTCDSDILVGGFGLFGGNGSYQASIKLFELGLKGGDNEGDGKLLAETKETQFSCGSREKYAMLFDKPVPIQAKMWYVAWATISGPLSDYGTQGLSTVHTEDSVVFTFKDTRKSGHRTNVTWGQLPQLLYKKL